MRLREADPFPNYCGSPHDVDMKYTSLLEKLVFPGLKLKYDYNRPMIVVYLIGHTVIFFNLYY